MGGRGEKIHLKGRKEEGKRGERKEDRDTRGEESHHYGRKEEGRREERKEEKRGVEGRKAHERGEKGREYTDKRDTDCPISHESRYGCSGLISF